MGDDGAGMASVTERESVVYVLPDKMGGVVNIIATPPPFDHTKLCTVDGEWSLIGSSNWDARSFRLNFEFDLEIIDRELTGRIDALIDERIARGKPLTPDMLVAEPRWKRPRNGPARGLLPDR